MTTRTRVFQIAAGILTVVAVASASGGKSQPSPPPTVNATPGQILIRESFGIGPNKERPTGGNGAMSPVGTGTDLGGFWAEFPGNNTMIWSTAGARRTQGWNISCSSVNTKETPSPLDDPQCSNGTATMSASHAGVAENPAALLPFSPPSIPYEVSVDLAQQPRTATDWFAVGFTSSNALNNNLESAGQVWMRLKITNAAVDFFHFTVELHTNGLAGTSVSAQEIVTNFDTLTVRYDPVNKTVTGLYNGAAFATLPYSAAGINHVGFEGSSALGIITVDNFQVKASN